ncbi:MAG: IMP dehydrogenase [Candidatus Aminicenantes bacterium]|nr:IMP dehydrogenase [Candidatus Aminicenantes bacterium]
MKVKDKIIAAEGLTFDDVLLVPDYSEVLPNQADTATKFSRHILLRIPLVSAAMDTVSEFRMAIAMAQLGGMAVIHKNLSIDEQAGEVLKVKRSESGMIANPITLRPDNTIQQALQLVKEKGISGLPIIDEQGKLVGILTNRDLRFATNTNEKISTIMKAKNLITAPVNFTMAEAKHLLHVNRIEKLPVVDRDNFLKGLITFKDILKTEKFPSASKDKMGRLLVGAAVSTGSDTIERVKALVEAKADVIVIDTSHAHSRKVFQTIEKVRSTADGLDLVVGNIATAAAARDLLKLGVDGIKVGIGPGSICTTRVVTGAGVPQISAIMAVAEETAGRVPVIADGGIKFSGDVTKALAAGADVVMIGSILAGTDESPGEMIIYQGRSYKKYRGMGSIAAMKAGSRDRYFQEDEYSESKLVPEGIEGRVPYRGTVMNLIPLLIGGVKAGMGLTGCRSIEELKKKSRFIRITHASLKESHVHDVIITEESPNYRLD